MADPAAWEAYRASGGEKNPITAHEIKKAIRKQLERDSNGSSIGWAIFEELRLGTGFALAPNAREDWESVARVATTIDVFALSTWPSKNYQRRAFEVKVSRSDLLAEFKNPDKRAPWFEYVNHFYLVAPSGLTTPAEVAELAPECGLMTFTRPDKLKDRNWSGLRTARLAPMVDGGEPSWRLVASILRAASKAS